MDTPNTPTPVEVPSQGFVFGDKLYTKLKWFTIIFLPALNTLYIALGAVWGLPYVTQVVGTISALTVFLGVLLGISTKSYNASDNRFIGDIVLKNTEDGRKIYQLEFNGDPGDLELLPEVTFKMKKEE